MIKTLREVIHSKLIDNVYLVGFLDKEGEVAEFYPDMRYIYILFDDKYIEFQSIKQSSKMKIMISDSVLHKFEIDEDMIPAKTSVNEIILVDTLADNSVREMILYNVESVTEDSIICDAVQIDLNSEQQVFLDPTFYYGIGIGGNNQYKCWISNLPKEISGSKNTMKICKV